MEVEGSGVGVIVMFCAILRCSRSCLKVSLDLAVALHAETNPGGPHGLLPR